MWRVLISAVAVLAGCGRSPLSLDVDAGPVDAGQVDAGPSCSSEVVPSIGPVRFEFPDQPCRFTQAQAAAGIAFRYSVVVSTTDAQFIDSAPPGAQSCPRPKTGLGLYVLEQVKGDAGVVYCVCDEGLCQPANVTHGAVPGRSELSFPWDGRTWFGPSDTSTPEGALLPPGDYVFSIVSTVGDSRTDPTPGDAVRGSFFFTITP
jgi:hypothetical protein